MSISELSMGIMQEINHYPVMYREVLEFLNMRDRNVIVDCTVGVGSHALQFIPFMKKDAILIGIDKDEESIKICSQRLKDFKERVRLVKDDFSNLESIMNTLNVGSADAFLFDLGISSYQLNAPDRGFSFTKEGPLDMRMNRGTFLCAYDLVSNLSEIELENIFRKFGEERYAKRIAHRIVETRKKDSIYTTTQLAQIVLRATPVKYRKYRIHPATRVFQALRIAVNRELENLSSGIKAAISLLNKGGRIAVISFHSLEDRIVKHTFKDNSLRDVLRIVTKKPLVPTPREKEENIASRSAKLRIAEKI